MFSIKISLKFVPKGPINNIPALVQITAWHRSVYRRIYVSLGLNELSTCPILVSHTHIYLYMYVWDTNLIITELVDVLGYPAKRVLSAMHKHGR